MSSTAPAPAPPSSSAPPSNVAAAAAAAAAAAPVAATKKTIKKASGDKPKKKVRRKKPAASSSRSSPMAARNVWANAASAQKELAQQSAQAASLRSDPLWYRTDDPLQSIARDSFMVASGGGVLSDEIDLVEAALQQNHLTRLDITPQAYGCLLEQARRYALELLADAQDYAHSANRQDVSRTDLMLAREMRADQPLATVTQQPKRLQMAQQLNRKPLPPIPTHCYNGVVLPSKEHQLTARTFDVISGARVAQRMVAAPPAAPSNKGTASDPPKPSYGASVGRQIPIHLNALSARPPGEGGTNTAEPSAFAAAAALPSTAATPPITATTAPATTAPAPLSTDPAPGDQAGAKRKADQI